MCGICTEKTRANKKKMAAKKTNHGQNGPDDRKAVGIPGTVPIMTDAQRDAIKARADAVKTVADELKKKYSPQGLEIEPGTMGKLKVTATFMRGHIVFHFMKQVAAERLAEVAADLDRAIAYKPQKK